MDILLADDDAPAREALADALRHAGHRVRVAVDGLQALATARHLAPDAAILDIDMPGLDGWQVARCLRADDRTGAMRLVALTGRAGAGDRARSALAGFDVHLVKPAMPGAVEAALRARA